MRNYPRELGGNAQANGILEWNRNGWPVAANMHLRCVGSSAEYHAKVEHIAEGLRLMEDRIRKGHIWGPFFDTLHKLPFTDSVLGADPITWPVFYKKESHKVRLLVNLSHQGQGGSFNDQIAQHEKTMRYLTVKDIVNLIIKCDLRWIYSLDALEAFYRVPIQSRFIPFLGVKICGVLFYFTSIVMGMASASKIYAEFADAVCWIITNQYPIIFKQKVGSCWVSLLRHYCDDFLGGHKDKAVAQRQFAFV